MENVVRLLRELRSRLPPLVQLLDGLKPANSAAVRVDIPVGSRWRYSGGGISIAQLAVEDETNTANNYQPVSFEVVRDNGRVVSMAVTSCSRARSISARSRAASMRASRASSS